MDANFPFLPFPTHVFAGRAKSRREYILLALEGEALYSFLEPVSPCCPGVLPLYAGLQAT